MFLRGQLDVVCQTDAFIKLYIHLKFQLQKMHDILGSLSSMAEAMTSSFEVDPVRKLIISVIEVFKI